MNYSFEFRDIFMNWDFFTEGLYYTALISILGMAIGMALGIITAAGRTSRVKPFRKIAAIYVEAFRNTPLLIQLWLFYFGLGQIGIDMSALTAGIVALGLNTGAYTAEIIRAGFEAIDKEILEAGASLGFTPWLIFRTITVPLGIRAVLPAIGNMAIQCMLASALLSVLGINELTNQALRLSSKTFRSFEAFSVSAVLYILLTLVYTGAFALINRKMAKGSLH